MLALLLALAACSPRQLILQEAATALATQGQAPEDDLVLAREASAFYLKLSESVLRETPGHVPLTVAVTSGYTQYAYAFVQLGADRLDAKDAQAAQKLRERAARLYQRAQGHAMTTLELHSPGLTKALANPTPAMWPRLAPDQVDLAYWAAASWGAHIALSKDQPHVVADLPLAMHLAQLAYASAPQHRRGSLASLMGTFEAARPGGSAQRAVDYFDEAIGLDGRVSAAAYVAKAEAIALPAGDRPAFESLLKQALVTSATNPDLSNSVMRERALWLLDNTDDLF
ncbi:TRAP transporter TatT component family protein [Rhodoferax sp. U11-2br]|uniref:TRAP transporter TatT component family protein n=1 Tax=Rhodoferax sp. U11-2br TaxID=2838878 RepID=UPI002036765A|nr:TRAP transporter TatT component family protein [Rhodoferax sp. U11-2br]